MAPYTSWKKKQQASTALLTHAARLILFRSLLLLLPLPLYYAKHWNEIEASWNLAAGVVIFAVHFAVCFMLSTIIHVPTRLGALYSQAG
jgi:uncharacterized membrane protein YadS